MPVKKEGVPKPAVKKNLLGDDSDDDNFMKTKVKPKQEIVKKASKKLLDSDDDGDMFTKKATVTAPALTVAQKQESKPAGKAGKSKKPLFDDDD